jgi:hypothetical protein
MARIKGDTANSHPFNNIIAFARDSITRRQFTGRVIRKTCDNLHIMTTFGEPPGEDTRQCCGARLGVVPLGEYAYPHL